MKTSSNHPYTWQQLFVSAGDQNIGEVKILSRCRNEPTIGFVTKISPDFSFCHPDTSYHTELLGIKNNIIKGCNIRSVTPLFFTLL